MNAIKIPCQECDKEFDITENDIKFYKEKGFGPPKRCKSCRQLLKNEDYTTKRLGLKQSTFIDNLKVFGMPEDVKKEHPNDGLWFGL